MYVQSIQEIPSLGFGQATKNCFSKYCTFSGRARRSEYWYFVIASGIIMIIPIMLLSIVVAFYAVDDMNNKNNEKGGQSDNNNNDTIFSFGIEIILIIPLISAGVRRLHDTGRSGCYYLLSFIPIADILLLLFLIEDSQQSINEYGPSPKYILMQEGSLINNSLATPQVVEGIPVPDYGYTQGYPQVNPYQQFPQYPQVNMQPNLYQEPNEQFPSSQDLLAKPVEST